MTAIEWTRGDDGSEGKTWNPVRGCSLVSDGCKNCYAMKQAHRFSAPGQPYEGLTQLGRHGPRWVGKARFVPEKLAEPLSWRKPRRVFVNSMSDLFHEDLDFEEIAAVFGVMAVCPQHTFQVLTKRPRRMLQWFKWADDQTDDGGEAELFVQSRAYNYLGERFPLHPIKGTYRRYPWPLRNVWLGASCEDQTAARNRIPLLRRCPAALHFVSLEPLLGPIEIDDRWLEWLPIAPDENDEAHLLPPLRWVIVGGESGPGARVCDVDWIREIVRACGINRTPCFVKQMGSRFDFRRRNGKGGDPREWPSELQIRQFPEALL
jgi:protein gp37